MTGKLEKTNQCYAIAKIAGIKFSETLYEDHKLDIIGLMPTNVYGLNDNFDKVNGHVIPAMITKFVEAKKKKLKKIGLLGTGKPIREFIHSDDLAEAIVKCLNTPNYKILNKLSNPSCDIILSFLMLWIRENILSETYNEMKHRC